MQVRRAVEYHTNALRQPPVGMWPSEGSVCAGDHPGHRRRPASSGSPATRKFSPRSTDGWVSRDAQRISCSIPRCSIGRGVEEAGQQAADHLSRSRPERSDRLPLPALRARAGGGRSGRQARGDRPGHRRPNAGRPALVQHHSRRRKLLGVLPRRRRRVPARAVSRLAQHPQDQAGARFAIIWPQHPPTRRSAICSPAVGSATTSASGSAIRRATAPGTCCTKRGHRLVERAAAKSVPADDLAQAWEELYIAEGSDWFWWFDDQHSSAQDWLFDQLFRKHLQNVYTLLGEEPPASWRGRSARAASPRQQFTQPTGLLDVEDRRPEDLFRMDQRRASTSPRQHAAR